MASLWLPNLLLSEELVEAGLLLHEAELESHERVALRQGLAWAREEAERAGQQRDPGVPSELYWQVRARPRGYCEFCGDKVRAGQRLEVEHMVSRLHGQALRIPWSILHAEPNLAGVCRPCNKRKGTTNLTPDDIRWMWNYHHFGGPSEEAHVLLFFADLLEKHAWDAIPLRVKVEADLGRKVEPKPTVGAFMRAKDWRTGRMVDAALLEIEQRQTLARQAQARRRRVLRAASKRMPS